ncbi:PIG-L family deacetylase [Streptomyces sp. So13.3]|uniref:PIG-L deacetylase family protein n=1 Tax=Streptomyces TaxID=1883 RepID=UPI001107106D|nr:MULTISPECIES: PIG-L family deacetylase [Streptomyces]MCZ4096053.1 PIG-L family deacetylase [Streptomyces sp. H39-C1]QNA74100.1 PIG-L family deacetylase [Streptomyces sp. So13.3]
MTTILAFHAHPDDEVLLTGGTLARLAAEGHRVVVAVACDGIMGEATRPDGTLRLDELRASAALLGVARVVHLGYADSGHGPLLFPDPPDRVRFARADVDEAASKLAELLSEERADVLLSYDAQGGYGHRDHVRVHEVGARAARLTGTRVLEATLPREPIDRVFRALRLLRVPVRYDPEVMRTSFTPRAAITHSINVRPYAQQKRAALAAHRSQAGEGKGRSSALFRLLIRLPAPIFGLVLGREWFVEAGAPPGPGRSGDLLGAGRG